MPKTGLFCCLYVDIESGLLRYSSQTMEEKEVVAECELLMMACVCLQVLMVAEKPSVAKMIAEHLSGSRFRIRKGQSRANQIFEFIKYFGPAQQKCKIIVTSVVGHIYGLNFEVYRRLFQPDSNDPVSKIMCPPPPPSPGEVNRTTLLEEIIQKDNNKKGKCEGKEGRTWKDKKEMERKLKDKIYAYVGGSKKNCT